MHNFDGVGDKSALITLPVLGDERGKLVVAESGAEILSRFDRVFWIYGTDKKVIRGMHANRKSEFVLFCVAGSCSVKVYEVDGSSQVFDLNSPEIGLYLPAMTWKEMLNFSPDSVLIVLSSERYDPDEYIRDWDEWKRTAGGAVSTC